MASLEAPVWNLTRNNIAQNHFCRFRVSGMWSWSRRLGPETVTSRSRDGLETY